MFWVTTTIRKWLNIKAIPTYFTLYVPRRAVKAQLCESFILGIPEGYKTAPFRETPGNRQRLKRTVLTRGHEEQQKQYRV